MRKARAIIQTPIGNLFTVDRDGILYFGIKEVCEGIGLRGHSPWSWHAERGDNRERFYQRYSKQRRDFTEHANGHGSITMISLEGLYDYLSNPRLKNGLTVMFLAWLSSNHPVADQSQDITAQESERTSAVYAVADQISMDEHEQCRQYIPPQPKRWRVQFVCPECGYQASSASKHCPDCGERLVV